MTQNFESQEKPQKKKKKNKSPLGKRIGVYQQSRLWLLTLLACGIVFLGFLVLPGAFRSEENALLSVLFVSLILLLPAAILASIVWFAFEALRPRKTIALYENGIQFVSKKQVKGYLWEDFATFELVITKSLETGKTQYYSYKFWPRDASATYDVDTNSYPALNPERLNKILKELHVKGTINFDTRINRESDNNN